MGRREKEVAFETRIFAPCCGSDFGGDAGSDSCTRHCRRLVVGTPSPILRLVLEPPVGMDLVVLEPSMGVVAGLVVLDL